MKNAEERLKQWATDEIAIDLGQGRTLFTREQFGHVLEYLKQSDVNTMDFYIVVKDALGQQWYVPFKTFTAADQVKKARGLLTDRKGRELIPIMACQFDTLDEIIKWAAGKIESTVQVYVPPVDSWMRPIG